MQTTDVAQKKPLDQQTYEEKLDSLAEAGLFTHEIRLRSDRFNVSHLFTFFSENDAREFAIDLVKAAREVHDEMEYDDLVCYTANEIFRNYDSPMMHKGWHLTVSCRFPRLGTSENIVSHSKFLFGHRFGARRMADPQSKVFVLYGGRDCDGYSWNHVSEYLGLDEAAAGCREQYDSADGPMGYSVITQDEFESHY